jgi:hypothetical protein
MKSTLPRGILIVFAILVCAASLAGCNYPGYSTNEPTGPQAQFTQAAQTLQVMLTENAPLLTQVSTATTILTPVTPTPPATATLRPSDAPAASPTATESLNLVFSDDFSQPVGWYTDETDEYTIDFFEGGYRITVDIPNGNIWSVREKEYSDVIVESLASRQAGAEDGYYGLICRQVDGDNFYALVISSNGDYGIAKMEEGEFEFIEEGQDDNGIIRRGNAVNKLRADCRGDSLRLIVNDTQLIEVTEDDFTSGGTGLMAGTRDTAGLQAWFDDFAIYQP